LAHLSQNMVGHWALFWTWWSTNRSTWCIVCNVGVLWLLSHVFWLCTCVSLAILHNMMHHYTIGFASADLSHNITAVPADKSIITSSFNILHITNRLSRLDLLASKLPNRREQLAASLSTAFLSVDGIKHNTWVFRGRNRFSHFSHLWLFKGNLRLFCVCVCVCIPMRVHNHI
jgi:hypothetical protein